MNIVMMLIMLIMLMMMVVVVVVDDDVDFVAVELVVALVLLPVMSHRLAVEVG